MEHRNFIPISESFQAATLRLLEDLGRGAKTAMGKHLGIHKNYVSNVLHGRRKWSTEQMDGIADFFKMTVPDMLIMGEELIRTGKCFTKAIELKGLMPNSTERVDKMCEIVTEEYRLGPEFLSIRTWPYARPQIHSRYMTGTIGDERLYEEMCSYVEEALGPRK